MKKSMVSRRKLSRVVVMTILLGGMIGSSAWAAKDDSEYYGTYENGIITITGEHVKAKDKAKENIYSKTQYVGVDGNSGHASLGTNVSQIKIKDGGVNAVVYGIKVDGNKAVTATSIVNGISVISSGGNNNAYGIWLGSTSTSTDISDLGSITASSSNNNAQSYGIYAEKGTSTISFKGVGATATQAITATAQNAANAYSIFVKPTDASNVELNVNFTNSILSGKVKADTTVVPPKVPQPSQTIIPTLNLTFNNGGVWNVKNGDVSGTVTANVNNGGTIKFAGVNESYSGGNVNVIVSNGGTIDTRSRDAQGVPTTGGTTKTVNLGSGNFTAATGSILSLDALTTPTGLTMDQIKTTGTVGGTIALGSVNIKVDTATSAWTDTKSANIFVNGTGEAQTGITITGKTTTATTDYIYTFEGSVNGKVNVTSKSSFDGTLPNVVQGKHDDGTAWETAQKINTYSLTGDLTLDKDLGTLDNSKRTSGLTINGNSKTLSTATSVDGTVTISGTTDILTVNNITISGFSMFADNSGTLNLSGVIFTGTTGNDVITGTGTTAISGTVTADKNIAQTVELKNGANLTAPSISVNSTGEVKGVYAEMANANTATAKLGSITAATTASMNAYGIYTNGGTSTITIKGVATNEANKAITATAGTGGTAYSIYAKGDGTTTVNFENTTLSGKVKVEGAGTKLNLSFDKDSSWDISDGTVGAGPAGKVDLGGGTLTFAEGSTLTIDAKVENGGPQENGKITIDSIKLGDPQHLGTATGVVTLADVKFSGDTVKWASAKEVTLVEGNCSGLGFTDVAFDYGDYTYEFAKKTVNANSNLVLTVTQSTESLPSVIQGGNITNYELKKDIDLKTDLGVFNEKTITRSSLIINGKKDEQGGKYKLSAKGKNGVTIKGANDILTFKNIIIDGFNTFAKVQNDKPAKEDNGKLILENVTFTNEPAGTTNDVENNGTMTITGGTTTFNKGIGGTGDTVVDANATLVLMDTTDESVTNHVTIKGTVDPKVSVFATGVNVQVDGGGTLVLTPGTLFANITQDKNSMMEVKAADLPRGTTFLTDVDKASQLNVKEGTITIDGAEEWGYYSMVSGKAVSNGTLKPTDLWDVKETLEQQGFMSEYDVKDGVITVEFRNIPLAVEANTSALAGVQQGAITMVNQITDAIGENVGILARPAQESVYDKTIWANYINSKETVNGMSIWRGEGNNTAKYHGVTVGADFYTTKKAIAGVALTYVTGDVMANPSDTVINNKTKYYGISFYDRITNGKSALTYDLGYSVGKNEITQNSYQTVTADAKTNAYTLGAKYEYAYNFKHSSLVPFASLRYLRLTSNDYTNSNGHNMSIDRQNLIVPKVGLAWTGNFEMPKCDWTFKPVAEVGYIWNLKGREADGTFTSRNSTYSVAYDTVDKSSYYTKLGLNFNKRNFTGGVSYRYAKGDAARQNSWNVNLNWSF